MHQSGDDRQSLTHLCWWDLQFNQNSPCVCLPQFCKDLYQGRHMQCLIQKVGIVTCIKMYTLIRLNVAIWMTIFIFAHKPHLSEILILILTLHLKCYFILLHCILLTFYYFMYNCWCKRKVSGIYVFIYFYSTYF